MRGLKGATFGLFRLRQELRDLAPGAVFLHSSVAGFLGRLALLGTSANIRVFYIPHCISFMRRDIGDFRRAMYRWLERLASARSAAYLACSISEADSIRATLPGVLCRVVENAILPPEIGMARAVSGDGPLTVVTVGGARPQKNPLGFAQLARRVRESHPEVRFLWIGDGDTHHRTSLESAGVTVTGWMTREEVFALLIKSHVYLSASLWEGMPVSVLEALAMGLPVVLSDCDGNRDVIVNGRSGFSFSTLEEGVLQVSRLLSDSQLRATVGAAGLEEFQRRFSFARYYFAMDALLKEK